jgi:integrase
MPCAVSKKTCSGVGFRKTVATLIDDEGLSARIGADHLRHSRISMTQDKYMPRGLVTPLSPTCRTAHHKRWMS